MSRLRLASTALAGAAGLALAAAPVSAQQALATVSVQGSQVQAFCLGAGGRLAGCTPESNVFTRTYEQRNAFVFTTGAGTCLDGALGRNHPVRLARCTGGLAQDWYHVDNRRIQNKANDLCLDVSGGRKQAGTPVILWPCSGADNQLFALVQVVKPSLVGALGREVPGGIRTITPQDLRSIQAGERDMNYAIAAGGYNLIGNASGNLVGQASSNAIAAGGGNAIAAGGGNAIAAGGGNAIAAGGGNAIAAGGGNLVGQAGTNAIAAGGGNAIAAGGGNYRTLSAAGDDAPPRLEAGPDFTCGVSGGAAYCWGYNGSNQLGLDPYVLQSPAPAAVAGGLSFTALSAYGTHVCGVAAGGRLWCWGRMGAVASRTPKAMGEGIAFRSVDVGDRFFCGVAADGRVFCQGKNASGELGDGTKIDKYYAPVALSGGLSFASVSAGARHACGVTTEGTAYCWGFNLMGQLGTGTTGQPSLAPVAVAGGLRFRSVSAGYDYTCGVTTANEAYCWGVNQYGQLGDGTVTTASRPVRVGTLMATSVSTGTSHTCAVATDGRVFCWGRNAYGELGDGTRTPRRTPAPVAGGVRFASVSVAMPRTCAPGTDGQGYCWGANPFGAHGDGTAEARLVPTKVTGWTSAGP